MSTITLYQANGACSFTPHALLLHLKIPHSVVRMKFGKTGRLVAADGSISEEDYLKIHPMGYVPALDVDGIIITEVPAILTYIASLAPDADLMGNDAIQRAKVIEWLCFLSGQLHGNGIAMRLRPSRFTDEESAYEGIEAKSRGVMEKCFSRIQDRVKGRQFAVGEDLTVADFNLYLFWRWGNQLDVPMAEKYPLYGEFLRHVEPLAGIKAAVQAEELQLYFAEK